MKKLIYFLTFVLLASLTLAFLPQPLAGTVKMEGLPVPEGLSLTQTNLRTGMEVLTKVDANGYFLVDWANYPFLTGDVIKISIDVCKSRPECNKEITLEAGVPSDLVHFEISGEAKDVVAKATYIYVCYDDSQVAVASQCPAQPPKILCWNEELVDSQDDCPEEPGDIFGLILTGLIAVGAGGMGGFLVFKNRAMSKGVGIKIYKGRDGKEKVLHKHPAIRGYHGPHVVHRESEERHPKGQLNPKYEKDEDGEGLQDMVEPPRLDVCIMISPHLDTILASQMRVADVVIFVDP